MSMLDHLVQVWSVVGQRGLQGNFPLTPAWRGVTALLRPASTRFGGSEGASKKYGTEGEAVMLMSLIGWASCNWALAATIVTAITSVNSSAMGLFAALVVFKLVSWHTCGVSRMLAVCIECHSRCI
jgi:hypothetical protein